MTGEVHELTGRTSTIIIPPWIRFLKHNVPKWFILLKASTPLFWNCKSFSLTLETPSRNVEHLCPFVQLKHFSFCFWELKNERRTDWDLIRFHTARKRRCSPGVKKRLRPNDSSLHVSEHEQMNKWVDSKHESCVSANSRPRTTRYSRASVQNQCLIFPRPG